MPTDGSGMSGVDAGVSMSSMLPEDVDQITQLEEQCFSNPWERHVFEAALISPLVYTLVVRRDKEVVGYLIAFHRGPEIEIANIAVAPPYRRRGYGSRLMAEALRVAVADGRRSAGLCVRESSAAAIRMYESFGFERAGISPGYYRSPPEDAVLMRKDLSLP